MLCSSILWKEVIRVDILALSMIFRVEHKLFVLSLLSMILAIGSSEMSFTTCRILFFIPNFLSFLLFVCFTLFGVYFFFIPMYSLDLFWNVTKLLGLSWVLFLIFVMCNYVCLI